MPDLFQPLNWNDGPGGGTPASVARGARRWESGIEALDVQGDGHDSRLASLEAALSGLLGAADVMTTAERLTTTPAEGKLVLDSDLPALLIGKPGGVGWWKVDVTSLTGAGSAGAPTLSGVLGPGGTVGQIDLTWTAVAGAAASGGRGPYILYESRSPSGVSGATALTGTSTSRTPGTTGGYDYYITAMVGGVETAASNHFVTSLPYVAPGGGGGATGTPAQILNIGPGSTQNHFNVGVGYSTGHVDKTQAQIVAGYAETPYFTPNPAGDAVRMRVFANGKTTSQQTGHPRVELRELDPDDSRKAQWNSGSGTHVCSATSTITHLPADAESTSTAKPWTCFGQIHDTDDIPAGYKGGDIVRLQVEDTGSHSINSLQLVARTHTPNGAATTETKTVIQSSYTVGDPINWKIEVIGGTCKIYLDNVVKKTIALNGPGCYFKAGTYAQFSTVSTDGGYPASSYAETEVKNLVVTHS